jgi:hypothetical protein
MFNVFTCSPLRMLGHKHDPFICFWLDFEDAGVLQHEMPRVEHLAPICVVNHEVWYLIYVFVTNVSYRCKVMLLDE